MLTPQFILKNFGGISDDLFFHFFEDLFIIFLSLGQLYFQRLNIIFIEFLFRCELQLDFSDLNPKLIIYTFMLF